MQSAVSYAYTEPQQYTFRGSSLPYCSVREAITLCKKSINQLPIRETPLKYQLDMDIGTIIHQHLQNILGIGGQIFGNWACRKCKWVSDTPQKGPVNHCGTFANYVELRVFHEGSGFSGSVDALISLADNKFLLVDFKTKNKRKLSGPVAFDKHHRSQIMAYKYLLKRPPHSLDIVSQAIVYIAREDISKFEVVDMPDDDGMSELEFEFYVQSRQRTHAALKLGSIDSLNGVCASIADNRYCPYNAICFGPNRSVILKTIWQKSKFGAGGGSSS